jgi:tRNA (adenine37-N6)-methyltransferase
VFEVKYSLDEKAVPLEGKSDVTARSLWSTADDASTFTLRLFEVTPGAMMPVLNYPHSHQIYILSGQGVLRGKSQEYELKPDVTILVTANEQHQLESTGSDPLRFLSCIPFSDEAMELNAQVSLYPLRQAKLTPLIGKALRIFRQYGLKVLPGTMSSVISGDSASIFAALQSAFERAAASDEVVMVTTISNACPVSESVKPEDLSFRSIGVVENEFTESNDPNILRESLSRIIIDPIFEDGLSGLTPGDKVMVVFHLHESEGYTLFQHPRGDPNRSKRGVFALRSPHRPNPIGVTEVEIIEMDGSILTVRGLDAIDGTPVLDLKPA